MIGESSRRSATREEPDVVRSRQRARLPQPERPRGDPPWDSRSNEVFVKVVDQLDDSGFRLPIPGHLALDAFNHPYAYAQSHEHDGDRVVQTASAE